MLVADMVLIGLTAMAFPAQAAARLLLVVAAIAVVSLVLNVILTPPRISHPGGARSLVQLRRTLSAHETERTGVAEELRDGVAQQLAGLSMQLAAARNAQDGRTLQQSLAAATESAAGATRTLTSIADRLAPAWRGEFGLMPALDALRRRVAGRGTVTIALETSGEPFALPLPTTRALLRVAEAAVENVERHAGAATASINVTFASPIVHVDVTDHAAGFDLALLDQAHGGLGLFRARELLAHEGGTMQIESAPGCGTRVLAAVDVATGGRT